FSHLANFFKRYYKDGDFVSLRRYKKDTYAIPYEGEEVKLHWANSDQYYIKSGEYFRDYTFTVNDKIIHLKLSDAETESNNNKATSDKERRFVILESNSCKVINDELYINFEYKAVGKGFKQDKLNEEAIAKALESIENLEFIIALNELAPTEKNKKRTLFEKHLKNYTSRNSFDYFIHKDLGEFLNRELDFYIKNEMLFLDDIMDSPIKYEEVMGKIKIFKQVSQKVISFLTQLEELQKKLWEKKKFVIETNYCITLDKIIDTSRHSVLDTESPKQKKEILNQVQHDRLKIILENKEQLAEWKELFDVDIQNIDDLKEEKYLVLDTKFFDMKFKYKLLSEFDNLDDDIDGVLINSENFGALSLLQNRYKEQVKTVYIDPPYNTGSDGFLYNDNYQHSSWMSFMYDRLSLSKELMTEDSAIFSSIDDTEQNNLININKIIFGENNFISTMIRENKAGSGHDSKTLAIEYDYIQLFSKNFSKLNFNRKVIDVDTDSKYKYSDSHLKKRGKYYLRDLDYKGSYSETSDYPITLPSGKVIYSGGKFGSPNTWRWGKEKFNWGIINDYIVLDDNKEKVYIKQYQFVDNEGNPYQRTVPFRALTKFMNGKGSQEVDNIFGEKSFSFPKSTEMISYLIKINSNDRTIVLDYFAGSGTTGHSVINLNREDKGKRKYLLIEMGEYFDTVTKPRIQKVIYSDSWKDGNPTTKNGVSQIFKYFKLESYEDTLNNLEFKKTEEQDKALDLYGEAKEDYILNYSLDVESQGSLLNIDTFSTPFNYKLKIATSSVGETKDTNIDLVETFNYLLGLVVKRIELLKGYLVVEGQNLKKEKILIIWRDGQSSDELNEFFKKMDWSVYDREFDTIYVNGDNNLDNLRKDEDHYKVKLIEQEFKRLMFGE
ncbi:MAG: site-specific DNA-methyltransferase, partial [Sulfurimonas sp.]|nr:site-specific DNA-methyltransferase [Sulfurimonas sp.]